MGWNSAGGNIAHFKEPGVSGERRGRSAASEGVRSDALPCHAHGRALEFQETQTEKGQKGRVGVISVYMAPRCFLPEGAAWGRPSLPRLVPGLPEQREERSQKRIGPELLGGTRSGASPWSFPEAASFVLRVLRPPPASPTLLFLRTLTVSSLLADLTLEPNFYVTAMPSEDRRDGDKGF